MLILKVKLKTMLQPVCIRDKKNKSHIFENKVVTLGKAAPVICYRDLWGLQSQLLCHGGAERRESGHKAQKATQ